MCARLLVLGVVAVLAAARPTTAQTVLFVNGGQTTGANTGVSWGDAFRGEGALQRALEAAGSPPLGGPMVEVWVAQGTYVPSARTDPAQPLSVTFRLRSRVQLYGGFVGTETSRPERDPWGNPTVLSGLVAPEVRAWHVVTTGGVDASCVLDGFVVRDGRAESHEPGIRSRGGGIYNVGGSPIVRNCAIVDNFAAYAQGLDREGGGVYTSDGSPRFVACEFRRNYGGLGAGLSGDATLIDCLFEGNISSGLDGWGGAAYGHLVARRCAFRDNFSKFAGGALLGSGTVEDCVFEGNDSDHSHSAMYGTFTVLRSEFRNNWGFGGPSVEGDSFTDCTFVSNTAGYSAGVDGRVFARCRFEEHRGTFGVRVRERAENCVFLRNNRPIFSDGAALTNCTLLENGPVTVEYSPSGSSIVVTNCIVWAVGTTQSHQFSPTGGGYVVNYSCIRGHDGTLGGVGNFGADPMLDPEGRPLPLSPCIDAGDGTALSAGAITDVLGQPRRVDDEGMPNRGVGLPPLDIGAIEFQGTSCYPNCDGSAVSPVLNVGDLTCFLERFTQGHPYANCDASAAPPVLNIMDFTCFLDRFQQGCP